MNGLNLHGAFPSQEGTRLVEISTAQADGHDAPKQQQCARSCPTRPNSDGRAEAEGTKARKSKALAIGRIEGFTPLAWGASSPDTSRNRRKDVSQLSDGGLVVCSSIIERELPLRSCGILAPVQSSKSMAHSSQVTPGWPGGAGANHWLSQQALTSSAKASIAVQLKGM